MLLTTHLQLVPRSRMHGAIPPTPNTPPWCGAQLKHRDNFTSPPPPPALSLFFYLMQSFQ